MAKIESIDWNYRTNNGASALTTALKFCHYEKHRRNKNLLWILTCPKVVYDIDHLKQQNVYDIAVTMCQSLLACHQVEDFDMPFERFTFENKKVLENMKNFLDEYQLLSKMNIPSRPTISDCPVSILLNTQFIDFSKG